MAAGIAALETPSAAARATAARWMRRRGAVREWTNCSRAARWFLSQTTVNGLCAGNWEHDILVEAVTDAEPGIAYPRCLTGRRACPPEDCGGMWGYEYLIEILAAPGHEEHDERLEWLGLDTADQFDPAAFDLAEVNSALSGFAAILIEN
ncbi:plasmid pRiA4b ORF-3 family protein [Kitasatospora sp. NBC_00240]|uniref:plasmid pRiA4b ORF-3 family protein n=1 Tax=Kitasatospora sp. NBC_00240 TaxID=2903567 RepID=UPI00224F29E8|nr:plasmid pRiA4b ORF-3 family protein [Kitasatospora sp. NBC_00240]MCX5215535.1 plasmid pRiA4b ORF-3 family protein [Kitasatospora sp. NBC_00240]